jgi:hypothetical protein
LTLGGYSVPATPAKKAYAKRVPDPKTVHLLTDDQVRKVIAAAFPKGPQHLPEGQKADDPEFVSALRHNINRQLKWLVPELNDEWMSDIEDIRRAFTQFGKKLANTTLLKEIGAVHYDLRRPPPPSTAGLVASVISQLTAAHQEVEKWLKDAKATIIVAARQSPLTDIEVVAGHFLPDVFQMTFLEKYGGGRTGPGPNFVAAILRESGVRTDDLKRVLESIKKARQRANNPEPLTNCKTEGSALLGDKASGQ